MLLAHCLKMMNRQTLKPAEILIVDFPATSKAVDITKRYRVGYESLYSKGFDFIAFIENDDWYAADYLEIMAANWKKYGRPDIFGLRRTIYYHIHQAAWFPMNHITRSSAMNTIIKPNLKIKWPLDHDPYTDIALWEQLNGITHSPNKEICMGMKHGTGLCGGANHTDFMHRYINLDSDQSYLLSIVDNDSFKFYQQLKQDEKIQSQST